MCQSLNFTTREILYLTQSKSSIFKFKNLKDHLTHLAYYLHHCIIDLKYVLQEDYKEIEHCTFLVLESTL
jgi:hypothetical protein